MASEFEAYIDGRLDAVQYAAAQGDSDTVMCQIAHLRAEAGSEAADVLTQKLIERGLGGFVRPPVSPPPSPPLPPAPPPTTASTTSTTLPLPAGDPPAVPNATSYKVLHPLTDFALGNKGCDDSAEGTLDIDELAPSYRKATLSNSDCNGGFGLSYGGKYVAKASLAQPNPDECESQEKRGSKQHFELDSVKPGRFALCVVSDEGNVAWVYVVDVDSKGALALKVIVWSPVVN